MRRTLETTLTLAILAGEIADGDHVRAHADGSLTVEPVRELAPRADRISTRLV